MSIELNGRKNTPDHLTRVTIPDLIFRELPFRWWMLTGCVQSPLVVEDSTDPWNVAKVDGVDLLSEIEVVHHWW